jgi:peptidoglycan/LPS O-acetylase OafA/YrhL
MSNDKTTRSFEGLRGMAALLVVIYHFGAPVEVFRTFYLFVDLFFILSGFIIYRAYENDLQTRDRVARFVLLRLGRIYPLHICALFLYVACVNTQFLLGHGAHDAFIPSIKSVVANLTLLQGIGRISHAPINIPSWSISTEFYTYLLMVAVVYTIKGNGRILAFALLAVGGLTAAGLDSIKNEDCLVAGHCAGAWRDYAIWRCVGGFSCGVLAYKIVQRFERQVSAWAKPIQIAAVLTSAVVVPGSVRYPALAFLADGTFLVLVVSLSFDRGPVASLFKLRPFQFLGRVSFSVYLVHSGFVGLLEVMSHGAIPLVIQFTAFITVVLVVSSFTYRFIEAPARDWTRRFADRQFGDRARLDAPAGAEVSKAT